MAHRLLTMRTVMNPRARLQSGYSLVEMLVVLAIVGIMTLITVPNFVSFYRSAKLKSSMRQVTADLRGARQHAVASNHMTRLRVNLAVNPGTYTIADSTDGGTTWVQYSPVQSTNKLKLQAPVFFYDSNLKDGTSSYSDFIFLTSGMTQLPSGTGIGTLVIKTQDSIPSPTYTVSVYSTGKISAK